MTMETSGYILRIDDVRQQYGQKVVLNDVHLSLKAGEFLSVVGPSGCGKSTLLRLVTGEEWPTAGRVMLNGQIIQRPGPDVGVVYQHYSLFPHLTALENIMAGERLRRWPQPIQGMLDLVSGEARRSRAEVQDEAMRFLDRARMSGHGDKYPHQLSGGQRQRVAIIQALMQHPKVLCMDEPFSALDPGTREDMQMFLLELYELLRMTVLFVTHDLEEAVYLGTRLVALSQFYTGEDGVQSGATLGAQIVTDRHLREIGVALAPGVKASAETGRLIQEIRREAFDPSYCQHVDTFTLHHKDSWHPEEDDET
ncbi:MAG: ABC transporter ATP-binding protein [Rhodospirillaceae bacterium]|nr:ABC transporter ATP-binding protein [Rhodospirillaceae bacterium]